MFPMCPIYREYGKIASGGLKMVIDLDKAFVWYMFPKMIQS